MGKRFWLMKSEPDVYSWDDLVSEGEGTWDGVRNHRAKNNLAAMKKGEKAILAPGGRPPETRGGGGTPAA